MKLSKRKINLRLRKLKKLYEIIALQNPSDILNSTFISKCVEFYGTSIYVIINGFIKNYQEFTLLDMKNFNELYGILKDINNKRNYKK